MHVMPLDDRRAAIVIDDENGNWIVRYADFESGSFEGFVIPGFGQILSTTINPANLAIWLINDEGALCAISHQVQKAIYVPMPPEAFAPFNVRFSEGRYYLCGGSSNIWYFVMSEGRWTPVIVPPPRPSAPQRAAGEASADYVRRMGSALLDYSNNYPPLFGSFSVGTDEYFVGGRGRVFRLRNGRVDDLWIDSGNRLIHGHEESGKAVICGGDPLTEIFSGTIEDGFELIYRNDEPALHMTATFLGKHYIGAGVDPNYSGPCLFTLEDGELAPVETGCAREPAQLSLLRTTGMVLWAVDRDGIFRLSDGRWTLKERAELS